MHIITQIDFGADVYADFTVSGESLSSPCAVYADKEMGLYDVWNHCRDYFRRPDEHSGRF